MLSLWRLFLVGTQILHTQDWYSMTCRLTPLSSSPSFSPLPSVLSYHILTLFPELPEREVIPVIAEEGKSQSFRLMISTLSQTCLNVNFLSYSVQQLLAISLNLGWG